MRRVRDETKAAFTSLLGVPEHGRRVIRADDDQVDRTERRQLDFARLAHRARIKGRNLVVVGVRRADEPRGVRQFGHTHPAGVDPVPLEPGAVVGEVGTDRSDE